MLLLTVKQQITIKYRVFLLFSSVSFCKYDYDHWPCSYVDLDVYIGTSSNPYVELYIV